MSKPINIIFNGPPGPKSGEFLEVETDDGKSINVGEWIEREHGMYWALRITELPDGPMDKAIEAKYIAAVRVMATHSLHPEQYRLFEIALNQLCVMRHIDNEVLAGCYIRLSGKSIHASDCATSQAPAEIPGPCDCDAPQDCPNCGSTIVDGKCSDVGGNNCGYTTE